MYKRNKTNQYYCLVAGLPELSIDMAVGAVDFGDLRSQITEELSPEDAKTLDTLYWFYDISNLINALKGNDMPHNELGTLTALQIQEEIEAQEVDEMPFVSKLPQAVEAILARYKQRVDDQDDIDPIDEEQLETQLWQSFYQTAASSPSEFIRIWSLIDRSLRNIIAAQKARAFGLDPSVVVVGDGEIVEQIKSSTASDFGLRTEFDYFEQLMSVIETTDMLEREHKMDALRWQITAELTDQNYFDINFLSAYLVKLNIIERWQALDKTIGKERFASIVGSFTAEVKL